MGDPALLADRINVEGYVSFSQTKYEMPFWANGEVKLLGARIGGNLECGNGSFRNRSGRALSAAGFTVEGDVSLKGIAAEGVIQLTASKILGALFLEKSQSPLNQLNLGEAHVGKLSDQVDAYGESLTFAGFTYQSIVPGSPADAKTRLEWLDKQTLKHSGKNGKDAEFKPQPWVQLRKVLREMGHIEDARRVAIALEDRRRHCGLIGESSGKTPQWARLIHKNLSEFFHWIFGFFTGYGYRPYKLLYWTLGVWLVCGGLFYIGSNNGVFAPSNPLVFQNHDYAACRPQTNKKHSWTRCPQLADEYPNFSPMAYSLNVLLPVVDLQQESAWGPIMSAPSKIWWRNVTALFSKLGDFTQLVIWAETIFGWIASLLLIAVVSGLTKKDNE